MTAVGDPVLAAAGLLIAGYLTLVQICVLSAPWDPIVGAGSSTQIVACLPGLSR